MIDRPMAAARSVAVARALMFAVSGFSFGFFVETFASGAPVWQETLYALLGGSLAYGAFAHALSHLGYVLQLRDREEKTNPALRDRGRQTRFGAMIPSYREEPEHVFRAMLSVALQRHDAKWIRLLVDDPPASSTIDDQRLLQAARALPDRVRSFLRPLELIVAEAADQASAEVARAPAALTQAHEQLASHFTRLATDWPVLTADDRFFRMMILQRLAADHTAEVGRTPREPEEALAELTRLRGRFTCDVASFERKRFANLSHAANKAMNLNVAIDLVGRRVSETPQGNGLHLQDSPRGACVIPAADYIITLDADSLLAPDYACRLLGIMTAKGSERVAVVQTPYAALPEATSLVERIAGATTDVQRLLHQGFARFDAAFWVGANAVLRLDALREIATEDVERGHAIRRYVQDRTPIEDTESTIDLAAKGWRVHNHDAILAWSATPQDFGALVIQRRRWACGGLIILPKAIQAAFLSDAPVAWRMLQLLIRAHYLGSLFWCPAALLALIAAPFDAELAGVFLPLVAVPYFAAYALDLLLSDRQLKDLFAVYGLNLLLVPVNLAGGLASLRQAVTGRKVPFARTPKIDDRTSVPASILVALWGGGILLLVSSGSDAWLGVATNAAFAGGNAAALLAAMLAYVGWRSTRADLLASFTFRRVCAESPDLRWAEPTALRYELSADGTTAPESHGARAA